MIHILSTTIVPYNTPYKKKKKNQPATKDIKIQLYLYTIIGAENA